MGVEEDEDDDEEEEEEETREEGRRRRDEEEGVEGICNFTHPPLIPDSQIPRWLYRVPRPPHVYPTAKFPGCSKVP